MTDQTQSILANYLRRQDYNLSIKDLNLQLLSNPDYPSVKSITDTLDYFGIENIAANIPKDALTQLPHFFLAIINKSNSTAIAQVDVKQKNVHLFDSNGHKDKLPVSKFKDIWNGTIIAIEKNTVESKVNSKSILKIPAIPLILIAFFSLLNNIIHFNIFGLIYTIVAVIGLIISYFIVRENIGIFTQSTAKICNSATENTSCGQVINSNHSKLFGVISLSDLVVTYFLSLLLIVSIIGYNASFFLALSLLATPIIFYTIYQQAFAIKKWCPLCLAVAVIVLGQTVLSIITNDVFLLDTKYSLTGLFVFGLTYISWLHIKSLFIESIRLNREATEHLKFKRNLKLFNTLLKEHPINEPIPINQNSLLFGNPKAKLTINAITNPMCGHCTKAFKSYSKLLQRHPEDVKLNIIFNVPFENLEHASSQIAQRIIELYQDSESSAFLALKKWFEIRDLKQWQTKYGLPNEDTKLTVLKEHKNICTANTINYTPATIINNYRFPKSYNIEDISFFIYTLAFLYFIVKEYI